MGFLLFVFTAWKVHVCVKYLLYFLFMFHFHFHHNVQFEVRSHVIFDSQWYFSGGPKKVRLVPPACVCVLMRTSLSLFLCLCVCVSLFHCSLSPEPVCSGQTVSSYLFFQGGWDHLTSSVHTFTQGMFASYSQSSSNCFTQPEEALENCIFLLPLLKNNEVRAMGRRRVSVLLQEISGCTWR